MRADVYGCMDASACNYDSSATVDDGSCTYNDAVEVCDGGSARSLLPIPLTSGC